MEGFALIDTGIWSIVPPLLALGLALLTKEVYSSLTIGVFVGMVIYTFTIDGVGFGSLVDAFCLVPQMMGEQIANNGALLLFFSRPALGLFTKDSTVIDFGQIAMRYFCPFYWLLAILHALQISGAVILPHEGCDRHTKAQNRKDIEAVDL